MAAVQRFRSQFRGFHREDVVRYIEYLNNQHNIQLEQLNNQLANAQGKADPVALLELQAQLDAALARCAELEQQLAQKEEPTEMELAAYRRAERAEREAQKRAQVIYDRANGALAEATALAEDAAKQLEEAAQRTMVQFADYQASIQSTADAFRSAAQTLYAVQPEEEE